MSISTKAPVPLLDAVPAPLRELPWKLWKYVPPKAASKKPQKIPISIHTFETSNEVVTFEDCGSFEDAKSLLEKEQLKPLDKQRFHGVACLIDPAKGLACVDLDDAIGVDGEPKPFAAEILNAVDGFVERSVSGTGYHIFTRIDPDHKSFSNNNTGVEFFVDKRFIAFTGHEEHRFSKPISTEPQNVETVLKYSTKQRNTDAFERFKQPDPEWTIGRVENELLAKLPKNLGYAEWLSVGQILHHQFEASYEGYELFDRWSASCENYPSAGEQSTWDKWQSFGSDKNRDNLTIGSLVQKARYYEQLNKYSSTSSEPLLSKLKVERKKVKKTCWLVDQLIKTKSLNMIGGAPAGGKTYFGLEMALSVASGKPMLGKYPTKQGEVVYVACEGRDSVLRRATAWLHTKNGSDDVEDFYISREGLVVVAPEQAETSTETMTAFMQENGINPVLIVIDTMNYSLGDAKENDSNDMTGYFMRLCSSFISRFDCAVVLVHHTNKEGLDIRGSSVIRGALDTLYLVNREDRSGQFKVVNSKHKDIEAIQTFWLGTDTVEFELPDGSIESNMSLRLSDRGRVVGPLEDFQITAFNALKAAPDRTMTKSELRDLAGVKKNNGSRDLFKPMENLGFIVDNGRTVTLIQESIDGMPSD